MIAKILSYLLTIRNYERIPKLPRGMLRGRYEQLSRDEDRVLARFGARDPVGVRVAMRRHGVSSVDDLVEQLEHYSPARRIMRRIARALTRGSYSRPPHQEEVRRLVGSHKQDLRHLDQRLKQWRD
jgi:hypothetical protein